MNREPDRPIEKALRDYGQSRAHQAAPAELHPATRAMLQAEVQRAIAQPLAASSEEATRNFARPFATTPHPPNWLPRFWPRLAFGATALAAFALVLTFIQQDNRRTTTTDSDDQGGRGGPVSTATSPTARPAPDFLGDRPAERAGAGEGSALAGRAGGEPVRFSAGGSTPQPVPAVAPLRDNAGREVVNAYREGAPRRVDREKLIAPAKDKNDNGVAVATDRLNRAPSAELPKLEKAKAETATVRDGAAPEPGLHLAPPAAPSASQALPAVEAGKPATAGVRPQAEPTMNAVRKDALAATVTPAAGTTAIGGFFASDKALRQEFSQDETRAKFRRNLLSPPMPDVLTNFRLESDGNRVVVTDADGSTYWGVVTPATGTDVQWSDRELGEEKKRTLDELQKQVRDLPAVTTGRLNEADSKLKASEAAPGATFYFRAAGTNRTLNQPVVFTGVFVPQPRDSDAERNLQTSPGSHMNESIDKRQRQRLTDPAPAARSVALPAQQPGSRGLAPLTPASGPSPQALGLNVSPTNTVVDLPQGITPAATRVQGTAVIGKDRIEINATPRK